MPQDTHPRLEEYLRRERELRAALQLAPSTILGGAVDAALSGMLAELEGALEELGRAEESTLQAMNRADELERIAERQPEPELEAPPARCASISDPVTYRDRGLDRTSRTRCLLAPDHAGPHEGVIGDGRSLRWVEIPEGGYRCMI